MILIVKLKKLLSFFINKFHLPFSPLFVFLPQCSTVFALAVHHKVQQTHRPWANCVD